ncbi:hypothetical protein RhiJN_26979 [Ceratobasidium sp. AG-Ba]|nr:hypothetical protein RhiJN_26979 [Ceratobasidium sp. AG-Ba]
MTHNEYPPAPLPTLESGVPPNVEQFNPREEKGAYEQSLKTETAKYGFLRGPQNLYFSISAMLGFRERFSLLLFIVFGGALVGFCLFGVVMMVPSNVETETVPGEWYWYRQPLFKKCIFVHIYLNIIAGVFAVFQFIPMIRRRNIILHRINGYFVLSTLLPAVITGSVVARRAFGGDINTQAAFYTLGSIIGFAALKGISNVRTTKIHRKWMLRTVTYTASTLTARIITSIARPIISISSAYFSTWSCDEVSFLLNSSSMAASLFPVCALSPGDDPKNVYVLVRASVNEDPINLGSAQRVTFGMALWLAMMIHAAGVEIYILATESYQWPVRSPESAERQSSETSSKA